MEETKMGKIKEDLRCPECSSTNTVTRIDQSRFCRRCGNEFNKNKKK